MRIHSLILTFFISSVACAQRPAQPPISSKIYSPQSLGYTLFWEDDFNGNALDTSKWAVRGIGARALGKIILYPVQSEYRISGSG